MNAIRYLPPGFKQNSTKITFMPENIFPGINLYPLLHFHGFEAKQETSYAQFFKTSHFKNNCSNPPGESILLKFCQMCLIDKNKKSPGLEVLDRAVLELWSII